MEKMQVTAKVPERKEGETIVQPLIGPFTIEVNTGSTAAELIELYGDEAVKTNALSNWTVTLQANMRNGMKKGETIEAIQARLADAKMGVAAQAPKVDAKQVFLMEFANATPERQQELLAELQAAAAAGK